MEVETRDHGTALLDVPCHFPMTAEVSAFLAQHPRLWGLLEQATLKVTEIFGESAIARVELHCDPEEGYEELFVVITAALSPKEAMDRLRRLDEEWLLHALAEAQGQFNVTVELG